MLYAKNYLSPLATIYRQRRLPVPGLVKRRVGDQVAADSVVAETDEPMGYRLLNLEKMMGVRVPDVRKVLVKKLNEPIKKGEVIARSGLLIKRQCVSPVNGAIIDARGNRILIEIAPRHIELTAFYPGRVVALVSNYGIELEVTGAVIEGVWGVGAELRAKLQRASPDGETPLQTEMITPKQIGSILIGGRTLTPEAIDKAVETRVGGVIVGSIPGELRPLIEAASLPVIITEGFGDAPMHPDTFDLLCSYLDREACFNPTTLVRRENRRPEVVIPLPADGQARDARQDVRLTVGTRVRATRAPYQGGIGNVVSLPAHSCRVESGVSVQGAQVDLGSAGRVFIPFENLEIIL